MTGGVFRFLQKLGTLALSPNEISEWGTSVLGFKFIGGPLDGEAFDHHQINALAEFVSMSSESGNRRIVLMPSLDECDRILRGAMFKGDVKSKLSSSAFGK